MADTVILFFCEHAKALRVITLEGKKTSYRESTIIKVRL
jgi:hypothetical protein